jgi:hypothetical protein
MMNERIKELATLATRQYSPTYYTQEWIQGFAQLIVRECQHRVEKYINECGEVASMPDTVIMKHFGVEE